MSCFGWFQDIVEHLVENSTTYNERTQFSKAKYKNKKMKKYDLASWCIDHLNVCAVKVNAENLLFSRHFVRFSILRPTTDLIAQMYYCRGASKIWWVWLFHLRNIESSAFDQLKKTIKILFAKICGLYTSMFQMYFLGQNGVQVRMISNWLI